MKLSITDLDRQDRPREKLEASGAAALSNAELLAILIGSGSAEENAVQLMQRVLYDTGNRLDALERMTIRELCHYKGVGPAKAITIKAACELGRRRVAEANRQPDKSYTSSEAIYKYIRHDYDTCTTEEARVILLNNSLHIVGTKLISRGGLTTTVVDIRLVLKEALLAGATAIVLCHNHPSGKATPSPQDDELTQRLKKAAQTMDIKLIDHLVVTDTSYYSYADEGRL